MKKILITLLLCVSVVITMQAQDYRYEVGAGVGMSGYLGDVNKSNVLQSPGLAGGLVFRYLPST